MSTKNAETKLPEVEPKTQSNETRQKSVFDQFTRKYSLSKTLRFELRPAGKTEEFLKKNKVFEKDKLIDDHYHEIKYYFDTLHREFIYKTLKNVSFPTARYQKYYDAVIRFKTARKDDKKREGSQLLRVEDKFREEIVGWFNKTAKIWKENFAKKGINIRNDDIEILFEESVLDVLEEKFKDSPEGADLRVPRIIFNDPSTGEKQNLFASFKGFFTYFSNFNNTKRNLYSAEDKDVAIANRAINENLRKFTENAIQFLERRNEYLQCHLSIKEQRTFEFDFYNKCFTQDGIDEYNCVIGGAFGESGEKIKGVNEKINLYNQQHKDKKLRQFAELYKQILSKKDKRERFAEIVDDSRVFPVLREFIGLNGDRLDKAKELMRRFFDGKYDVERVYAKGSALNTISQKWFNNWSAIGNLFQSEDRKIKKFSEEGEIIKLPDLVSVARLKKALESRSVPETENYAAAEDLFRMEYKDIYAGAKDYYGTFLKIWEREWEKCMVEYDVAKSEVEALTSKMPYQANDAEQVEKIKRYCDAALAVYQMIKYFALEKGRKKIVPENGIDNEFYNLFDACYEDWLVPSYFNEFRNYLTRKAYLGRLLFPSFKGLEQRHSFSKRNLGGAEKIKLNFENGMLLSGWDRNKESDYYGVLFRDKEKYLLGLVTPDYHDLFKNHELFSGGSGSDDIFKIEYRQLNNVFRQLPRIAFADRNKEKYGITKELEDVREDFKKFQGEKKKDKKNKFDSEKLEKLINLYKRVLRDSFGEDFEFGEALDRKYTSLNDFFSTIERLTYSIKFFPVRRIYIEKAVSEGKMFLFDISNKDFEKKKRTKDNLHTLYFKALFQKNNLENPTFKLSGGAEVFFRPKNEHLAKKKNKADKTVVDHKRYGDDKIFLHLPIVLNMGIGNDFGFNGEINKLIASDKKSKNIKIIGIDRGEKHLAYFALIDQDGNLLKNGNLDGHLPNDETYLKKLEEKAGKRDEQRKEWKTIENIKELKNGYISWVVHFLADLMIKENALLIFEDLNIGFKRGRQKIEKQVYQKLELALVQKLNYLVQKDAIEGAAGHYLNAYQLTPQVATPQDIGKQCGAVFYVSPGYTSLTCPECGYRKNISFNFENIKKAREIIRKNNLHVVSKGGAFNFSYEAFDEGGKSKGIFKVSSDVKRIRWHKRGVENAKADSTKGEKLIENSKSGMVKEYDMTLVFSQLFKDNRIMCEKQVLSPSELTIPETSDYYRRLFWYLNLLLHSRNSISGTETDYIQCPHCHFHSDKGFQGRKYNGDANGAYNIARKGLLALRKIQVATDPAKIKWGDLKVSIDEWDKFTQIKWNPTFKSQK